MKNILAATTVLFTNLLTPANASISDTLSTISSMVSALESGSKDAICRQGGACRKFTGLGCKYSRNLFSTCMVICGDTAGFKDSGCFKNAASKFKFDKTKLKYPKTSHHGEESAAEHIIRQLNKPPHERGEMDSKYWIAFCTAQVARPLVPLINSKDAPAIAKACTTFFTQYKSDNGPSINPMSQGVMEQNAALNQVSGSQELAESEIDVAGNIHVPTADIHPDIAIEATKSGNSNLPVAEAQLQPSNATPEIMAAH